MRAAGTVDLSGVSVRERSSYEIFDPLVEGPLHLLPRREARKAYDWFIRQIPTRIELLGELLIAEAGVELSLGALSKVQVWFDETTRIETSGSEEPTAFVYSLCNDLGMFLGQSMVERHERIAWTMCTFGKRYLYYQRPVLIGFDVPNPKYIVDFDYALCAYAHRLALGQPSEVELFERMFFETENKTAKRT